MAEYDDITAKHYAAWRPPLHQRILTAALATGERFAEGLDIGCGTGSSTHALAAFCERVVGIDPSPQMIDLAKPGEQVQFIPQTKYPGKLDQGFLDGQFDVFTLAGSLHYQDPGQVLEEISWLAAEPATIIVYDFDVELHPVFAALGTIPVAGTYDHAKNFGKDTRFGLRKIKEVRDSMAFSASPEQLGNLLFSVEPWRTGILKEKDYADLVRQLRELLGNEINLEAVTYLTRYLLP